MKVIKQKKMKKGNKPTKVVVSPCCETSGSQNF